MASYYKKVFGNLRPGDTAKAEDINQIQTSIEDSIRSVIIDHHENQSFILGNRENDFVLTPVPKVFGRYLDTYSVPTDKDLYPLSLREYSYRQPIAKTKSSMYSFICKMGNRTSHNVDVVCELQDIEGNTLRRDIVTLKANTDKREYEFIFDLKSYPTSPGFNMEELEKTEGMYIPPKTDEEESYKEVIFNHDEKDIYNFSVGISQLYVEFKALGIQKFDKDKDGKEFTEELNEESFVLYADKNGEYGATSDLYLEQKQGNIYQKTPYSLYFKDVYSTDINYLCTGGEAIVGGEKVLCMDSHVSISGASEYGNVLSLVYMDTNGHLHSINSKASATNTSMDVNDWEMEEPMPLSYLLIAKILIYNSSTKEPLVIQDDTTQETRPRSHHERLRRLEKELDYTKDIAIPPRIKYTLTGSDWIDTEGDLGLLSKIYQSPSTNNDADKYPFYTTLDEKGNIIVKTTQNEITTYAVTLKDDAVDTTTSNILATTETVATEGKSSSATFKAEDTEGTLKAYDIHDLRRLNRISEMQNVKLDATNGIISLKMKTTENNNQ